jgi:hypothetical protein
MSHIYELPPFKFENEELQRVVSRLGQIAFSLVDVRYGIESERPLDYHGIQHVYDVSEAVYLLGQELGVRERPLANLVIAGFFHDAEQDLIGPRANEMASAGTAVHEMRKITRVIGQGRQRWFKGRDFDDVSKLIPDTAAYLEDGDVIQYPISRYGSILADADLASLCRPTGIYWSEAKKLFKEQHPQTNLTGQTLLNYVKRQIVLLTNHRFFNQVEVEKVFPHRQDNIVFLENMLKTENPSIPSVQAA